MVLGLRAGNLWSIGDISSILVCRRCFLVTSETAAVEDETSTRTGQGAKQQARGANPRVQQLNAF